MISFFITEMENIYCAVRTGSLHKIDYVSSVQGYNIQAVVILHFIFSACWAY